MFRLLTGIFIFLIILTIYLHISYHLKTSNEDAVYETTFQSKEQLDNICKSYCSFLSERVFNREVWKYKYSHKKCRYK